MVTILTDLANNIGGSPYYNINSTYYNGSNAHIVNSVTYGGSTTNNYSRGTSLSDAAIQGVVIEEAWYLLVPAAGVEPATFRSGGERSNPLSYAGKTIDKLWFVEDGNIKGRQIKVRQVNSGSKKDNIRSRGLP